MLKHKIGILCPNPDILFHYEPIFKHLPQGSFELVATHYEDAFLEALEPYPHTYAHPLMQQKVRYRVTLSHYYLLYYDQIHQGQPTGEKVYLPQLIGETNVRLMYALGKDFWNYDTWNRIYDVHLCFGPWQAERLKAFKSRIYQVGYPRYDAYIKGEIDTEALKARFNCPSEKQTLVWLPTKTQHTLKAFAPQMAQLSSKYHIILKPHPATWEEEPELMDWLKKFPFELVQDPTDTQLLMALADFVICDYGGPPFGAVYMDKNLLLLDHTPDQHFELADHPFEIQGPKTTAHLNPSEEYLRQYIPHCGSEDDLAGTLQNTELWKSQKQVRTQLREQFFARSDGQSGKKSAEILFSLLES